MFLGISFISFILLNQIQPSSSVTFSQSYVRKDDIIGGGLAKQNNRHPRETRKPYSISSLDSTGLLHFRGGAGEKNEDNGGLSDFFSSDDDVLPHSLRVLVDETISSQRKIIVVTGGVLSGIGKGVTASSIGVLLRAMGLRVTALKIDPYLNVDAGTMSPFEHGEVFVLDDGGETDLDLGNYERFLSVSLTKESNLSTGKIYQVRIRDKGHIAILL